MRKIVFLAALFTVTLSAFSQQKSLSKDDQQAVQDTQNLLRDEKQRQDAIRSSPDAQKALAPLQALGATKEQTDSVFNMSADIFKVIAEKSGGDASKMQALLQEAAKNPEAFFKSLPATEQAKIRALAGDLEKNKAMK